MQRVIAAAYLILQLGHLGTPSPILEYDKGVRYEEYIVEHEISAGQAKNAALAIDLKSVTIPAGCQKCSKADIKYCLGMDLVNDHCCCDKRYQEVLPFVPHTCYFGSEVCRTEADDCDAYKRLRRCCCDRYVLQIRKKKSQGVRRSANHDVVAIALIVHILYIAVYCYT